MAIMKTTKVEVTLGNGQLRGLRKVTVARAVTVECAACGTIRNKIVSLANGAVASLAKNVEAEMQRTRHCPYCGGTECRTLEAEEALAV